MGTRKVDTNTSSVHTVRMKEVWKELDVPGVLLKYEVSNLGRVRRVGGRVLRPMRTGAKRRGSQRSKVRLRTHPRMDFDVAHLVLEAFVAPRPTGCVSMHLNDDSSDNSVSNLRWGTKSDNVLDSIRKGRGGNQKLNAADVGEIRRRRAAGETGAKLAKEFRVSQQRICDIYKGRSALIEEG